jgi:hypothetical protein
VTAADLEAQAAALAAAALSDETKFSAETREVLRRWAWNTPEAQKVWTVLPPEGTRVRCRYEPPCDFHMEDGAPGEMCRWRRR